MNKIIDWIKAHQKLFTTIVIIVLVFIFCLIFSKFIYQIFTTGFIAQIINLIRGKSKILSKEDYEKKMKEYDEAIRKKNEELAKKEAELLQIQKDEVAIRERIKKVKDEVAQMSPQEKHDYVNSL